MITILLSLFLLGIAGAQTIDQSTAPLPILTSTWVATDALGRKVKAADDEDISFPKEHRWVGVFYYIWQGYHGNTVYDISKLLKENPSNPAFGPQHSFHYWGEPEAGYYKSNDPWVMRRNLQMLATAGVDFIHFDLTNAVTYDSTVRSMCRMVKEMRLDGIPAPSISASTWSYSGRTINYIYDQFYSNNDCKEVWFQWWGKPLLFGKPDDSELRSEVKSTFDIKYSWAWTDAYNNANHWQWLDLFPQDFGWSGTRSNVEQMPVAVASHPTANRGKSYHNFSQPSYNELAIPQEVDQGLHFEEQWQRLHEVDPQVTMITQWNEYIAQRFICNTNGDGCSDFLGKKLSTGQSYFVDVYNQEYNRDIEPMKEGWTDNYYYQMASHIRKVKGMSKPNQTIHASNIQIDGWIDDWNLVQPIHMDWRGDNAHRNWPGVQTSTTYQNTFGRNDIVRALIQADSASIHFLVQSDSNLSESTDKNWMVLLIDSDRSAQTGWHGFDFKVQGPIQNHKRALYTWNKNTWEFVDSVISTMSGKNLELSIPRWSLGLFADRIDFEFKWVDNVSTNSQDEISVFFIEGDVAPDRRWNYLHQDSVPMRLPAQVLYDVTPGLLMQRFAHSLPQFPVNWTKALDSSIASVISIPPSVPADSFALRMSGYIWIPFPGTWNFRLSSDDGSRMSIDGHEFLNLDGVHATVSQQVASGLSSGLHSISLDYFELFGDQNLQLEWSGPNVNWQPIPASQFFHLNSKVRPYIHTITLPGKVEAEHFDYGGQGVGYFDSTQINQGKQLRIWEGVDITQIDSGFAVGWNAKGEWQQYQIQVIDEGPYRIKSRYSSPNGVTHAIQLFIDNNMLSETIEFTATGSYANYRQTTKTIEVFLPKGSHTLRIEVKQAGFNLDYIAFDKFVPVTLQIPKDLNPSKSLDKGQFDLIGRKQR